MPAGAVHAAAGPASSISPEPSRIGVRIARKEIESGERLGRRRRVIERTVSWPAGYRRLNLRYERRPRSHLAFLGLAAALVCHQRLIRLPQRTRSAGVY
ncbi:hypothetical protein GCM10010405_43130 [Streptomyces macrosporus]|uniref:Transposase n=1 Tax=Streptomyces macrosporus TaxID=44032 RepID=A0ABP5XG28_9ACTN